jgi:outer membrane biosynthesis protein TonB
VPSPSATPALAGGAARFDEPRFSLIHALGVAVLLHLLLLLLASVAPDILFAPGLLLAQEPDRPPPIKFTFIDVPDDHVVEENPDARLVSDKAREEAGPTPTETTPEGLDPPSTGNTRERVAGGVEAVPQPLPRPPADQLPRPAPPTPRPREQPPTATEPEMPADPGEAQEEETPDSSPAQRPEPTGRSEVTEPGPGPGGVEDGGDEGRNQRRLDPKQEKFSKALDELVPRSLPTDLQAVAPPQDSPADPSQGTSTIWSFDNPNPAFPVNIGTLSFDSKGADFGPWLKEFHARVLNEWNRNLAEWHERVWREALGTRFVSDAEKWNAYAMRMNSIRGVTGVIFNVTREGSVVALQMIHASGSIDLDRSVQKTLRNVILPPLPPDYPDDILQIRAGFYYNVDPPQR